MPKIQPHEDIGPNNAGKMVIRGILFAGVDPKLKAEVEDYLSARGTVSSVSLSKETSKGVMNSDEIQFMRKLMGELRKLEFSPQEILKVTAKETGEQRDSMVYLIKTELDNFIKSQQAKGKEVSFTGVALTILRNVDARTPVSYQATTKWEEQEVVRKMSASQGTYVPPSVPPPGMPKEAGPKKGVVIPPQMGVDDGGGYVPPTYVPPPNIPTKAGPKKEVVPPPQMEVGDGGGYVPPPYVPSRGMPKPEPQKDVGPSGSGSYVPPPYIPPSDPKPQPQVNERRDGGGPAKPKEGGFGMKMFEANEAAKQAEEAIRKMMDDKGQDKQVKKERSTPTPSGK